MSRIEFIETKRGGKKLLCEGRQYHRRKQYINGNSFWQCYNKKGCIGNIILNSQNDVIKQKKHDADCVSNPAKNIILTKVAALKTKISSNLNPIQKQFEEMIRELQEDGVHRMIELPEFSSLKTGLYSGRHRKLGAAKLGFKSPLEVDVPEKFQDFLLGDYNDAERILVFCSRDIVKRILGDFEHFLFDGTFISCPLPFRQIYTIHGHYSKTSKVIPLFYAFLQYKTETTYKILLSLILSQFPFWNPKKITLDYEKSAKNAIQKVFPEATVKGCFFHYRNSLLKRAKQLRMKSRVQIRHIARYAALSRLPPEYITQGHNYILGRAPKSILIEDFEEYFKRIWLTDEQQIKMWCSYGEVPMMKYHVEEWHSTLNKYVGRKYPSLATVLEVLVKETRVRIINNNVIKNEYYNEIDMEVDSAIRELNEDSITVGHCIEIIAPYYI